MKNIPRAQEFLFFLFYSGVQEICICSGARNAPFLSLLSYKNSLFKTYSFFEERSAAFFALGRIKKTNRPVAVITTSGTAVANLLPATVEAFYSQAPLLLVSSDRPFSYRGSGAPQTIEQVGIFSQFVEKVVDLQEKESFQKLSSVYISKKPIHFNICFSDALKESPLELSKVEFQRFIKTNQSFLKASQRIIHKKEKYSYKKKFLKDQVILKKSLSSLFKPLILVSELSGFSEDEKKDLLGFLKKLSIPIFVECLSGFKDDLQSHSLIPERALDFYSYDFILKIGATPTVRFWRELEKTKPPLLNITATPFSGVSYQKEDLVSPRSFLDFVKKQNVHKFWREDVGDFNFELVLYEHERRKQIHLNQYLNSEAYVIERLSKIIPSKAQLFLSNSLPIRLWDLWAKNSNSSEGSLTYYANRGANGIDGIISTFLGVCKGYSENWLIIGDLSALYDLSALWATHQLQDLRFKIVILNNGGGQIFSQIFKNYFNYFQKTDLFLNTHDLCFQSWAQMWGVDYLLIKEDQDFDKICKKDRVIVEVPIDTEQSLRVFEKLWN